MRRPAATTVLDLLGAAFLVAGLTLVCWRFGGPLLGSGAGLLAAGGALLAASWRAASAGAGVRR